MLEGLDCKMEDDTIREICRLLHSTRLKYAHLLLLISGRVGGYDLLGIGFFLSVSFYEDLSESGRWIFVKCG